MIKEVPEYIFAQEFNYRVALNNNNNNNNNKEGLY